MYPPEYMADTYLTDSLQRMSPTQPCYHMLDFSPVMK